ncbi:uncharacterized protein KY384_008540 [Bacidia gigantensis]|uniref:uncharacterized protein n=1 Tax=Bacidia gigantensis TaxID=2732470 RepID=UPI001D05926A|nr:uncharacterized protein KY384_008540 [Bacidia gigantensis]KAG8527111.1 hypothetical protein KY384_008540 [Bacidia gigantensis]
MATPRFLSVRFKFRFRGDGDLISKAESPELPQITFLMIRCLVISRSLHGRSHLATLGNNDIAHRPTLLLDASVLDFSDHVHAVDDFAEDDVFVVQEGGCYCCDEELAAVGVGSGILWILVGVSGVGAVRRYRHAEQTGRVVLQFEVFVGERFRSVDGGATGAVAVEEVAALDHEVVDLLMVLLRMRLVSTSHKVYDQALPPNVKSKKTTGFAAASLLLAMVTTMDGGVNEAARS